MKQFEISGNNIYGGEKCQTSYDTQDGCDSFTSTSESVGTDWCADVTCDLPGDGNPGKDCTGNVTSDLVVTGGSSTAGINLNKTIPYRTN